MKKHLLGLLLIAVMALFMLPITAKADNAKAPTEAYVIYTSADFTLTFYYDNQKNNRTVGNGDYIYDVPTNSEKKTDCPWTQENTPYHTVLQSVVIDDSFANNHSFVSTAFWFNFGDYSPVTSITGLDNIDTSNVENMESMFMACAKVTSLDVSSFDTSKVKNMKSMFRGCDALETLDVGGFDTSKVTSMEKMFYKCSTLSLIDVSNFKTSNVINMSEMFHECSSVEYLDVADFDTTNVTNMKEMFSECKNLVSLDVSKFKTSNVTDMNHMFMRCLSITSLDVSNFDTSNVEDMGSMFYTCKKVEALDVSGFVTDKVIDMSAMFGGCQGVSVLDVSNFDTSKVTNMQSMFAGCSSLQSLDLSNFDTSQVTNMTAMFGACSNVESLDISTFSTEAKPTIAQMFNACSSLKIVYVGAEWDVTECTGANVFIGCSDNLKGGSGTIWSKNNVNCDYAKIDGGTSDPGYFSPAVFVKADNLSKVCNGKESLTATVTGLRDGDKVVYDITREKGETPGQYKITPAGEAYQGIYKVCYFSGTLTITHDTLTAVDGKKPTVSEAGYKECYKCNGCGTYFEDRDAQTSIGDESAYKKWIAEGGKGYIEKIPAYTVTITCDSDGTAVAKADGASFTAVEAQTTITLEATPVDGYEFDAWEVVSGDVTIDGNKFTIGTKNVVIKAKFKAITYTVKFSTNGSEAVADQVINKGTPCKEPAKPELKGNVFGGWFTDAECTKAFDFTTLIEQDIVLYAKWTPAFTISDEKVDEYSRLIGIDFKAVEKNGALKITWSKVGDADGYFVYAGKCGKSLDPVKPQRVKGAKKTSLTLKTIGSKKYDKKEDYKVYVVAYKTVDGEDFPIAETVTAHVAGSKMKYTNAKAITVKSSNVSVKKGKSVALNAKVTKTDTKKIFLGSKHAPKLRYEASSNKIKVDANGKVKGVKKGTAYVYIYAQNGMCKKVKVTVK